MYLRLTTFDSKVDYGKSTVDGFITSWAQVLESWSNELALFLLFHAHLTLFICALVFLGPWFLLFPVLAFEIFIYFVLYPFGFAYSKLIYEAGPPTSLYRSLVASPRSPIAMLSVFLVGAGQWYNNITTKSGGVIVLRLAGAVVGSWVAWEVWIKPFLAIYWG